MKIKSVITTALAIAALCLASCTKPFEDLKPSLSQSNVKIYSGETATVTFTLNDVRGNEVKTSLNYKSTEKYDISVSLPVGSETGTLTIKAPEAIYVSTSFDVELSFSDAASGRTASAKVTVNPVIKALEDLNPVFDPATATVKDGDVVVSSFKLNDVRGNKIDWNVKIEGTDWYCYATWCEMTSDYTSGKIHIFAPDVITSDDPISVNVTFTDAANSRTSVGKITLNPVKSTKYVEFTEHANSFVVAPGSMVMFPLFKGNTDEKAVIDDLVLGWEDNKGLFDRWQVLDGLSGKARVKFGDGIEGNVVLYGVLGKEVVWSWHFWVTSDAPKDVTVGGYTFLDRNIGALNLDEKSELSSGVVYQYGRKDPMPGIKFTAYEMRPAYGEKGVDVPFAIQKNVEADNLANAIKNPTIFYNNVFVSGQKHGYSWITTDAVAYGADKLKALWDNDGKKTAYDPCPAGYKVASVAAWTAVKTASTDVKELWDSSFETFDESAIGTNAKYIPGNKKKVQFRGCVYNGLRLTVTGELSSSSTTFSYKNCVGAALPTAVVWCSDIDPDFATKPNVSCFRGCATKVNTSGNGNYDDISAIKVNALSTSAKYLLDYAFPVRCVREK